MDGHFPESDTYMYIPPEMHIAHCPLNNINKQLNEPHCFDVYPSVSIGQICHSNNSSKSRELNMYVVYSSRQQNVNCVGVGVDMPYSLCIFRFVYSDFNSTVNSFKLRIVHISM